MMKPLLLILTLLVAGCATTPPGTLPTVNDSAPYLSPHYGRVVRVNVEDRYVILECSLLPNPGQLITLYRNKEQSGVVQVQIHRSGNHAAADVLEGFPMVGDWYVLTQTVSNKQD